MKRILVTQRVDVSPSGQERLDGLDQAWWPFLTRCEILPTLVPNNLSSATEIAAETNWDGLLLTGGNDLARLGGEAPERDRVESFLLDRALAAGIPVLGVCRGMQFLLDHFGLALGEVEGHVQEHQEIQIHGVNSRVNSYHRWGCHSVSPEFEVWARAQDGVVKAIRHRQHRVTGIMWHPERLNPLRSEDVALFRHEFSGTAPTEQGHS